MPVDLLVLGAALLTGLLGGAHCAAMCGGIATGLSIGSRGWWAAVQPNLGRVLGYVLAGAIVLVVADLLARTLLAPVEVPVGIVTALAGGPFFLWILVRRERAR